MAAARESLELPKEPAEMIREIELLRLDHMQACLAAKITRGSAIAISAAVSIMRRRSAMLGLDTPTKVESSGPGGGPQEHRVAVEDASNKLRRQGGGADEDARRTGSGGDGAALMALALVEPIARLTDSERSAVAEAFRSLEAARRLPTSHARTVALELAERRVSRAKAILAAAHRRR